MITIIRGCVACYVFFSESGNLNIWLIFKKISALTLKNKSTVLNGFFPYLAQMITSMRGCVAYNGLWPWLISSRSFDLDFENCVRSVTFSVLDRLFPYFPQIIITNRGCVACWIYNKILKFQFFANFSAFTLKQNLQFCLHSFHTWHKSSLASESVSHVMTFDLDLYFQDRSAFDGGYPRRRHRLIYLVFII